MGYAYVEKNTTGNWGTNIQVKTPYHYALVVDDRLDIAKLVKTALEMIKKEASSTRTVIL